MNIIKWIGSSNKSNKFIYSKISSNAIAHKKYFIYSFIKSINWLEKNEPVQYIERGEYKQ